MGLTLVLLAFFLVLPISAVDYTVGGNSGWNLGVNYESWLAGKTFQVGDKLVFTYDSTHTVDEVNQAGYTGCSKLSLITSASDVNATFTLTAAGTRYFICGVSNHCQRGMKLQVVVGMAGAPGYTPGSSQSYGVSKLPHSMYSLVLAVPFIVSLILGLVS